ncbi:hypothetical protein FRZ61_13660 [Hypericibacter adhaerens]|uniref:Uncharacterized protein n=1 Tax=Hypericibacter adhaerens TaxID=2602016 RepID=A0A5J6MVW2_9PROT|nr:glycosyltransferase [Hypericibacter adhaerens]QEX21441.1 hypothetical protein FRZ61_13660 [Hypericibacter adhaerens]
MAGVTSPVVLVVALPDSVHAQRWMKMMRRHGFRLLLLPIYAAAVDDPDDCWRIVGDREAGETLLPGQIGIIDLAALRARSRLPAKAARFPAKEDSVSVIRNLIPPTDVVAAIQEFSPDLVHSLEIQHAGYLCLAAKRWLGTRFPRWLLSNWGSDVFLYRKLPDHAAILKEIACSIDAYLSECRRDVNIVRELGYAGPIQDPLPASGGIDFASVPSLDALPRPSRRRMILVKGYHNWAGRALHVLSAIHLAAAELRHVPIRVNLASTEVKAMIRDIAENDGLDIEAAPHLADHRDAVARLGQARITLGFGISDGISTTLLEAMAVGTFPIQSDTSCACEWIRNGVDGIILPVHQTRDLASALVRASKDDALVDNAAARNRGVVEARWSAARNGPIVAEFYRAILAMTHATAGRGVARQ